MPFFLETDCSLDLEIMPVRAGNYACACVRASTMSVEGGEGKKDGERRENAVGVCGVSSTRR